MSETKEAKKKDIEVVIVSYQDYVSYDFIEPGMFFVMSASQEYFFFKTGDRNKAQQKCNELFGENFYTVKTSRNIKTKSRLESGTYSAYGNNTRRGMAANLRKTV